MPSYNQNKKNRLWDVRFRYKIGADNIQKKLSGFKTKSAAELAYIDFKRSLSDDQKEIFSLNFGVLFEKYKAFKKETIKESSYLTIVGNVEKYILPFFKSHDIFKIKKQDMFEWQLYMEKQTLESGKKISCRTKQKSLQILVGIFNFAIDMYDLPLNPASKSIIFKETEIKKEMQIWSENEFLCFIQKIKKEDFVYKVLFSFLYLTGCRRGEALGMTWKDICFRKQEAKINKSVTYKTTDESKFKITTPKNSSSNRVIPFSNNLMSLLTELKESSKNNDDFQETDFVFYGKRPLPQTSIARRLEHYAKAAEVKIIRVHDLRHSHASLLINKGQNIISIAKRLGHKDIELTLNTYSHIMPGDNEKIVNALNFATF